MTIKTMKEFYGWEKATRDTIDFKKIYCDIAGDVRAGLVLSELVYWYLPSKSGETKLRVQHNGYYWIAIRRYEWWERTRMSPRQSDTDINKLIKMGVIEKGRWKFYGNVTVHVRIIESEFLRLFNQMVKSPPTNPFLPNGKLELTESDNSNSPNEAIPYTESTAENTEDSLDENVEIIVEDSDVDIPVVNTPSWDDEKDTHVVHGNDEEEDEERVVSNLSLVIENAYPKAPSKLSATMNRKLTIKMTGIVDGLPVEMECPDDLYDRDALFRGFVRDIIIAQKGYVQPPKRISKSALVQAVCGYNRADGWIEYEIKNKEKYARTFSDADDIPDDDIYGDEF
jgi:hypothetical protein